MVRPHCCTDPEHAHAQSAAPMLTFNPPRSGAQAATGREEPHSGRGLTRVPFQGRAFPPFSARSGPDRGHKDADICDGHRDGITCAIRHASPLGPRWRPPCPAGGPSLASAAVVRAPPGPSASPSSPAWCFQNRGRPTKTVCPGRRTRTARLSDAGDLSTLLDAVDNCVPSDGRRV